MKAEYIQPKICPKCGKEYSSPPALSRADSKTLICPECGTKEALEYLGLDPEEQEKILDTISHYTEGGDRNEANDA